jgi:leucine dehydrogenase
LAAVGSPVDASSATAFGTIGAVEAVLQNSLDQAPAGRALVHGCGAVGGPVAKALIASGWQVFTVDMDSARAQISGAIPLDPGSAWWTQELDLLLPCSISGLITADISAALQVKSVVPAANAPFADPDLAEQMRLRGVRVLPDPLVNAGAVIADSIERFAPEAWKQASPEQVYAFVRQAVRDRASDFLAQRDRGLSVGEALMHVAAGSSQDPIGLSFVLPA